MNDLRDSHDLDVLLVDHLRRSADDAVPLAQLDAIVSSDRTARVMPMDRRSTSGRGRLLVAAAALAALGVGALAVVDSSDERAGVPADGPELPAPVVPVVPGAATIGNYVPSGTVDLGVGSTLAEARFDSEDTSYARLVGPADPRSSTPDQSPTVIISIWRSMSIVTGPPPIPDTETPATLDGLPVIIQTDAVGDHHLIEFTRPDGDEVRIEGTAITLTVFVEVVEDLVYADPQRWSTMVDALAAPSATELPVTVPMDAGPVATELPQPGVVDTLAPPDDVSVGTTQPFTTDEAGVTVPSGTSRPIESSPVRTVPLADLAMLVVEPPSRWLLTSTVVGEVDQSVWSNETSAATVIVTVTPAEVPVATYVPESFPIETVVEPRGLVFVDEDPATTGVSVRSDRDGRQHVVELYAFEDRSDSPFQVSISFTETSLDDVTEFLSTVRGVDQDEWQQIADAAG
ncbi:MAG: hypothetical protein WA964_20760 [Ilumatobacter sp.]|uniref:hypothetical protein n=1 Tax=Ilumatobacter sp. TaxID=1967498 RepID=UPI003C79110C